jgi:hypothetical protein
MTTETNDLKMAARRMADSYLDARVATDDELRGYLIDLKQAADRALDAIATGQSQPGGFDFAATGTKVEVGFAVRREQAIATGRLGRVVGA